MSAKHLIQCLVHIRSSVRERHFNYGPPSNYCVLSFWWDIWFGFYQQINTSYYQSIQFPRQLPDCKLLDHRKVYHLTTNFFHVLQFVIKSIQFKDHLLKKYFKAFKSVLRAENTLSQIIAKQQKCKWGRKVDWYQKEAKVTQL